MADQFLFTVFDPEDPNKIPVSEVAEILEHELLEDSGLRLRLRNADGSEATFTLQPDPE